MKLSGESERAWMSQSTSDSVGNLAADPLFMDHLVRQSTEDTCEREPTVTMKSKVVCIYAGSPQFQVTYT